MRALLAAAIFLTCVGPVGAKPSPPETPRLAPSPSDLAIAVGAAGAMMESDYFQAPQAQFSGRGVFACRLQVEMFSKVRLAQACR
jgi:hypothetical protein